MFKPRSSQGSFLDVDYLCESLIPPDSFYKKFREVVAPLINTINSSKNFSDSRREFRQSIRPALDRV